MRTSIMTRQILSRMATIERLYGRCFHEIFPEIDKEYHEMEKEYIRNKLGVINHKLCKIIDDYSKD